MNQSELSFTFSYALVHVFVFSVVVHIGGHWPSHSVGYSKRSFRSLLQAGIPTVYARVGAMSLVGFLRIYTICPKTMVRLFILIV